MHTENTFGSGPGFESSFDFVHPRLSYVGIEGIPLSQNALEQHTTKLESSLTLPSPPFRDFSLSPIPSSVTSSTFDDTASDYFLIPPQYPSKRPKTQSSAKISPAGTTVKSIKPASFPCTGNSTSQQIQPRRYRPILPAPPRLQNQPNGPSIQPRPVAPSTLAQKTQLNSKPKSKSPPFQHLPTNLPPTSYPKGQDSPFLPEKLQGTIPGSMLETLPLLEARFDRLEMALNKYAQSRYELALKNSLIEGLESNY